MLSQRLQALAVAVFVLVIAGVVAVLLSRADTEAPAEPKASETQEPDADPSTAAGDPIGATSLAVGDDAIVMRIKSGSCSRPGGPRLELSRNTGRTFHQIRVPQVDDGSGVSAASPSVRAIVWADAESPAKITVGAADTECKVHRYTTDDGGGTWTQEGDLEEWHVDPATGGIVSPTGPTDTGCKGLIAFSASSQKTAKAFCKAGAVRGTSSGGDVWAGLGRLTDVSATVFTSAQVGYAAVVEDGCKSRIHATVNGGASWAPVGCVAEGFVISGFAGTSERLVAGGAGGVRLSTDRGRTWEPPTMK